MTVKTAALAQTNSSAVCHIQQTLSPRGQVLLNELVEILPAINGEEFRDGEASEAEPLTSPHYLHKPTSVGSPGSRFAAQRD